MQFLSHSTQETEAIGEELAQKLCGGDVLAFTGCLLYTSDAADE